MLLSYYRRLKRIKKCFYYPLNPIKCKRLYDLIKKDPIFSGDEEYYMTQSGFSFLSLFRYNLKRKLSS